jgi:ABC-2 type transport system permease protein
MFRSVWSKSLRDYRVPILGWGIGLGFLLFAVLATYATQITSASARAGLAEAYQSLRFFGDAVAMTTPQGYATFRIMELFLPVMLSIWTLLAGSRLVRGEEERGSIDVLLSTPQSRVRILVEKMAALVVAILLIGLLIGLLGIAGDAAAKIDVDVPGSLLAGLNVSMLGLFFAGLALLLSQFLTSRAAAAGITGAALALSFVLDATGRTVDNVQWLQRFSPLYYYNLSKPLIASYTPTHGVNPWAMAFLFALGVALLVMSIPLFVRRNIGESALAARNYRTAKARPNSIGQELKRAHQDVFVRTVGLRALRAHATGIFWWLLGLCLWAVWGTSLTKSLEEPLQKVLQGAPLFARLFGGHDMATNAGFIAFIVFLFIPVIAMIFTMNQALAWSSDLDNGQLEVVLSTPESRTRVVLERFAAVLIPLVLVPLLIWPSVLAGAAIVDLSVDPGQVASAAFGILPLELIVASLVFLLAGRLPSGVILGITALFIGVSYFAELLHQLLNLPDWVLSLSVFHQYGMPLTDGLNWGAFFAMTGIAVVLLVLGVVQFDRADVSRAA